MNVLVKHPRSGFPPTVLYNLSYLQLQLQLQVGLVLTPRIYRLYFIGIHGRFQSVKFQHQFTNCNGINSAILKFSFYSFFRQWHSAEGFSNQPRASHYAHSGVASYEALGNVPLLKFWKRINLTVKISKITKENHSFIHSGNL